MRHQAKPFAVEVRKNRRSPADAPTPVIPESDAVPTRFQEAEKLFRRAPQQPATDKAAIEAGRPRTILPDLSSPTPPAQPAKAARLRKSALRNDDAPADLAPPTASRRRRPADDVPVADAPASRKRTGAAPKPPSSAVRKATASKVVEVRAPAVAVAPRQRDTRPARGEFLPGQRWKRRLAPRLR